jgi:CheY-like chemotaxis protein
MDDEDLIRDLVGEILRVLGYKAEFAVEGSEAISMYEKALNSDQPYDLVIMDLTIPGGMGGREAVQRLRQIDPKAKTVVSSGYSNDAILADFKKYGFSGVLPKPYNVDAVGQLLERMLELNDGDPEEESLA